MATTLLIEDKTTATLRTMGPTFSLAVPENCCTVRDLIRARVQQEVEAYNAAQPEFFRTLVQPAEAEVTLNGFRMVMKRQLNWETQFNRAIEAFKGNNFIVLIDGHQVEGLDDSVQPDTVKSVVFVKLMPLVGG
jgi:hypothetical protein